MPILYNNKCVGGLNKMNLRTPSSQSWKWIFCILVGLRHQTPVVQDQSLPRFADDQPYSATRDGVKAQAYWCYCNHPIAQWNGGCKATFCVSKSKRINNEATRHAPYLVINWQIRYSIVFNAKRYKLRNMKLPSIFLPLTCNCWVKHKTSPKVSNSGLDWVFFLGII
jgi:hypothetical protein